MSRADPSAATGQQPYEPGVCATCTTEPCRLSTFHTLNETTGQRGACSAWGCGCKTFTDSGPGGVRAAAITGNTLSPPPRGGRRKPGPDPNRRSDPS